MEPKPFETVKTPDVRIQLSTRLECECPYDETTTDRYDLTVEIQPAGETVELESFAEWLVELTETPRSHEALTDRIHSTIQRELPDAEVVVELSGNHYGIDATVET